MRLLHHVSCVVWFTAPMLLAMTALVALADAQIKPKTTFKIGALLESPPSSTDEEGVSLQELALHEAVQLVNTPGGNFSVKLEVNVERLAPAEDSFLATKRVCRLLAGGAVALLGPPSQQLGRHLRSIGDDRSIPVLEARPARARHGEPAAVNLYPHPPVLAQAIADIVKASLWREFAVLYEDNDSLVNVQDILKLPRGKDGVQITLQKLPHRGDYRHVLRAMRQAGLVNFVVDCSTNKVLKFLQDAQKVGMIIKKYSYFITDLDMQTLPLEDFRYAGSNITGLRLVDPLSAAVVASLVRWKTSLVQSGAPPVDFTSRYPLTVGAALAYDAVHLLAHGLHALHLPSDVVRELGGGAGGRDTAAAPHGCDAGQTWPHGDSLLNFMKLVRFGGLSGPVEFDVHGRRSKFLLDVVQLQEQDLVKIASWSSKGLDPLPVNTLPTKQNRTSHHIVVTTVMKKPYTMLKPSSELRHGNDRFEGICVDLMDRLAKIHNFNYTLIVNPDGTAGKPDPVTGRWNGMIGDLRNKRAHFAIADLTITGTRGKAVNFTTQWMSLGISLVYTRPMQQPPSLFSFLSPFSLDVWAYMGMAMVGVSFLMFALARFSPYEWTNAHPCDDEPEELENDLTALNSYWFAIGSLMQQGSDIAPKAMSTRMVAGIWWSFTLIMISSYTANLAAFLTIETRYSAIETAEDLLKPRNNFIQYGLYGRGSTADFFRNSKVWPFTELWKRMNKTPSVFRSSDEEGIRSVIEGDGTYAYFMESSSIEYYVARKCMLTQVGALLDNKGYGIGVAAHSPIPASELSETIIQLQEEGVLSHLKNRWWKGETGGVNCDADSSTGVKSLTLKNVGGVFVCLILGLSVATIVAVLEFLLAAYRTSKEEQVPFAVEVRREMQFVTQMRGNTKPVKRPVTARDGTDDDEGFVTFSSEASSLRYAPAGFHVRPFAARVT